jgi:hypothetical protein
MRSHILNWERTGKLDRTWWLLFLCVMSAIAADCASTIQFMTKVGHQEELHPGVRLAASWFGPFVGPLVAFVGKVAAYVALTLARPKWTPVLATICVVVFLGAAVWNFHSVAGL